MTIFSRAFTKDSALVSNLIAALAAIGLAGLRRAARKSAGEELLPAVAARTGSPDPNPQADLEGLRRLDPETISRVHNKYFPTVYRYARYRLSDDALAEDVAGETFTRLLENIHRGRGPGTNLRGWLMRTAANLVNDYYRQLYGRPTEELLESVPSDSPDPSSQLDAADEKRALRAALEKLTEEQVHVLALRFGSGLSLNETADALGKNANAIKALQFRAIGALRKQLSGIG